MADSFRYTLEHEARMIFASILEKSAPRGVVGATPKYSATFGIGEEDFKKIVKIEVDAIKSELGEFSGNPGDYYLACTSGESAAKRVLAKAALDARGKPSDEAMKIKERAESRAELYRQFAGILTCSSQYDISLAKLEDGKIVDIGTDELSRARARDLFYPGAWAVPSVVFKGFRRKQMDGKDGVTCYIQNLLFVRHDERLGGGGPAPNNKVFGGFQGYTPEDPLKLAPGNEELDDEVPF